MQTALAKLIGCNGRRDIIRIIDVIYWATLGERGLCPGVKPCGGVIPDDSGRVICRAAAALEVCDPARLSGRMQPGVEGERLLKFQAIETCGLEQVENQVPAMSRYRARNRHEAMATKTIIAKGLLARARNPRSQPIGVWHGVAFDGAAATPGSKRAVAEATWRHYSEAIRVHTWPCNTRSPLSAFAAHDSH